MSLANTPWPKFRQNARNTGQSPYASSAADGTLKWQYLAGGRISSSPAIAPDGTIYFGSEDHYFYALNPDGTLKWRYLTGDKISSSPAIASDGTIYFGSYDCYFYALNPDGTLKWRYLTGSRISSSPAIAPDGTIYFGSEDHYFHALNPDGTLKWKRADLAVTFNCCPAIAPDGTIYIGSWYKKFYALTPNGELKWVYQTTGNIDSSPAIAPDGTIFLGHWGGFCALNPDGTLKWERTDLGMAFGGCPAIAPDAIYISNCGCYLFALDFNGATKWQYCLGDYVPYPPVVDSGGTIYFGSIYGDFTSSHPCYFYALNPDGTLKWQYLVGDRVLSSLAIASDGTIYFGSHDCYFYALGTTKLPLKCEPPTLLTHNITCAKPAIILQAPTPADPPTGPAKWRLHFKIQSYADAGGTLLINQVDSSTNPELFKYSSDNGLTWRDFPADGLPREQYGALVRAKVEVGPRKQVWLKASVGAEDA